MNTLTTIALSAAPILIGLFFIYRSIGGLPLLFRRFAFDKDKGGHVPNTASYRIIAAINITLVLVAAYYAIGFGFSNYPTSHGNYQLSACEQAHVGQFVSTELGDQLRIKHIDSAKKACI